MGEVRGGGGGVIHPDAIFFYTVFHSLKWLFLLKISKQKGRFPKFYFLYLKLL